MTRNCCNGTYIAWRTGGTLGKWAATPASPSSIIGISPSRRKSVFPPTYHLHGQHLVVANSSKHCSMFSSVSLYVHKKTEGLLGTGAQDGRLDFHTAPELCSMLMVQLNLSPEQTTQVERAMTLSRDGPSRQHGARDWAVGLVQVSVEVVSACFLNVLFTCWL